jgi:hypothetical protein
MVGMVCLLRQCTHAAALLCTTRTQQIVVHDNCTATKQDAAGMNGWHGSAHSAMHTYGSARMILQHAANCVMISTTATIKIPEWLAWIAYVECACSTRSALLYLAAPITLYSIPSVKDVQLDGLARGSACCSNARVPACCSTNTQQIV